MAAHDRVETALRSAEPARALRALVEDLARQGNTKTMIYELLEGSLVELRKQPDYREAYEDALLDTMDSLTGWSHPTAELLPEKPR
jgi:hypothetical protein